MKINLETAQKILADLTDGQIFSVDFIKRTTGEKRHMVCRKGVKKYLAGGIKKYSAKAKNLVTVYDVQKEGYRSINLDSIISMKMHKNSFVIA